MNIILKKSSSASVLFRSIVKGNNFLTPDLLGYYKIKRGAAEVTSGTGFSGGLIYGVTIVYDGKHDHDKSKCLHSIDEVNEYLNYLK